MSLWNPLLHDCHVVEEKHLSLLRDWASLKKQTHASFFDVVYLSCSDCGLGLEWARTRRDVRKAGWDLAYSLLDRQISNDRVRGFAWRSWSDCVDAVVASSFPQVREWSFLDNDGGFPFQCGLDLIHVGLVPIFDGSSWSFHTGLRMEVVMKVGS